MKQVIVLTAIAATLAGCNATSQRLLGYGPYQYCRGHDVCLQAGETWEFYPFAEGDASRFAQQGRECWSESNRANWDSCTARLR